MLFYDFQNFEEFKELFGIVEHGNGVKSRKNKILLSLYKDRNWLRHHVECKNFLDARDAYDHLCNSIDRAIEHDSTNLRRKKLARMAAKCPTPQYPDLLLPSLNELKKALYDIMSTYFYCSGEHRYLMRLNGREFYSDKYETDSFVGLCEDGTLNAIRYYNTENERTFKMKAGKMFNHLMNCNIYAKELPEQIKRWFSEEFVAEWVEYARENIGETKYTLHVDDDFEAIYTKSRCVGNGSGNYSFGSCMASTSQWRFYEDAVEAKAAYLTDCDGKIVARCVIFTEVEDEDGKMWRLAERQYSAGGRPELQRQLVNALIKGGHIDGYKQVGSSCGDAENFVDNEGNALNRKRFSISCNLCCGDTLSYQDSFKWYDECDHMAYNYDACGAYDRLDTTDSTFGGEETDWSEYNQERIPSDQSFYVDTRDDYFYENQVVYDYSRSEYCFEVDCIQIGDSWYYAGRNAEDPGSHGIGYCEWCEEYFLAEDGHYSEITEESYCCLDCLEKAEQQYKEDNWTWSEWDEEYFEDSDDVMVALIWRDSCYQEITITVDSFDYLVSKGEAVEYDELCYIDNVVGDGYPEHFRAEEAV